jgi:hypothetical protein
MIEQARSGAMTDPPLMMMPIDSSMFVALLIGHDPTSLPSFYDLGHTRLVSNGDASGEE